MDDRNLIGVRKSSPVLFTVPGQLYDYDPRKTNHLNISSRLDIKKGTEPSPIDADQKGEVCPWWLNEIDLGFAHWNVLHRLNWSKSEMPATEVALADLGLDPSITYLVYEFWTDTMLGQVKETMKIPALEALGLRSYAIREKLNRPQLISTNRHLSQGAVELESLEWNGKALTGTSRIVADDRYTIVIHVPDGYKLDKAIFGEDITAKVRRDKEIAQVSIKPEKTQSIKWSISFEQKSEFNVK
jgi:hypothetical protein